MNYRANILNRFFGQPGLAGFLSLLLSSASLSIYAQNLLKNGSFEQVYPQLTGDGYTVPFGGLATNAVVGWDFDVSGGNAYDGIANGTGADFARNVIEDGSYEAFLQGIGSISQTVTLAAGTYRLSFYAMGRVPFGPNTIALSLGDLVNETFTPTNTTQSSSNDWTFYSYDFIAPVTGIFVLRFAGTIPYFPFSTSIPYSRGSDFTTFIDNISIIASGTTNISRILSVGEIPNVESVLPTYEIIFVGDDITSGATPYSPPADTAAVQCAKNLSQQLGVTVHIATPGYGGQTSTDWMSGSGTNSALQRATDAARSLEKEQHGKLIFSIMLAANIAGGAPYGAAVSRSSYRENLQSMINQFLAKYPDAYIFLHYPIFSPTNAQNRTSSAPIALKQLRSCLPEIDALVSTNAVLHPDRVFAGDKSAMDYFSTRYSTAIAPDGGFQETLSRNPNATDAAVLGRYWADAIGAVLKKRAPPVRVLFRSSQVRNLTANEAAQSLPVHLLGVMIGTVETDSNRHAIILQDQAVGICVTTPSNSRDILSSFHRGDLLEIEGFTANTDFAPFVQVELARKLGTVPVPGAQAASYQQLISGASDSQWVEVKGVVRHCFESESTGPMSGFVVEVDGGLIQVTLGGQPAPGVEPDAEVRVDGICLNRFNRKRQAAVPTLQVPADVQVIVEKYAPTHPYLTPIQSPASLWAFSSQNYYGFRHRVHVRGTVTHAQTGSCIWIHGDNKGLQVLTRQQEHLDPGDVIDVLGFPVFGMSAPHLDDAVFRKLDSVSPPVPINLTNLDEAFDRQDDLVSVEGVLVQIQSYLNGISLTLDKNGQSFKAVLKTAQPFRSNIDGQIGADVRIIGICTLANDDGPSSSGLPQPRSFQIFLRSPSDFGVIRSPPWWTPQHIVLILGIATSVLIVAVSAVLIVSRQRLLQQQRQREMAEAEFATILLERNRLSREIHDTLAQGMTAVLIQLRLAKKHINHGGGTPLQNLDTALTLLGSSLREARDSIWNMRPQVLEKSSLSEALEGILKQMADGTEIETRIETIGKPRGLSPVIENNVLRIGQEAITNALKYSGARRINLSLNYGKEQFLLSVTDDGLGFDPLALNEGKGGFGLVGMRERACELNGQLEIRSSRGRGAEIILCIPLMRT